MRGLLLRLVREEDWKRRGSKWQITRLKLISSVLLALNSFNFFVAQNPAPAPSSTPAATPAATFATVPTATPATRSSKEVEELMEAAIKEKEARVLSKNKERVGGLGRENQERKEKMGKSARRRRRN